MHLFLKQKVKLSFNKIPHFFISKKRWQIFSVVVIFCLFFPLSGHAIPRVAGSLPQPGESLSNLSQGWIDQINNSNDYLAPWAGFTRNVKDGGIVPTSPNDYGAFLKLYGGYDWTQVNAAGITNAQYLTSDPNQTGGIFTYSDSDLLKSWTDGKPLDKPFWNYVTAPVAQATSTAGGAINSGVSAVGSWVTGKIWQVVIGVLAIIATFCKWLVELAGLVLDAVLNATFYNTFLTNNSLINTGWIITRDLCNMFFLLILLFVAFCTILQIEKYHAKKTLLMLIIMALLINFSKPIAIFIFDGSQLLMNYFLNLIGSSGGSFSARLTNGSQVAGIIYNNLPGMSGVTDKTGLGIAVQYLFAIVFLFMYAVALIVLGVYLIIRVVAIMLIVIVSPFAFLAEILPDFKSIGTQWWTALFKYSYVGPIIAFFLLLSLKLATTIAPVKTGVATLDETIKNITQYLVVLVFLYASIIVSEKFSIMGAGAITSRANKALGWGAKHMTGYSTARYGAKKGAMATGIPQAYQQVKEDWQRRGIPIGGGRRLGGAEKRERRAAAIAEGMGVRGAYMAHLRKSADNYKNLSNDELIAEAKKGNAAAALAAADRGKLDKGMLDEVYKRNPKLFRDKDGNWDGGSEYAGMMFKNNVEKGQAHVFTAFEAEKSGMTKTEAVQKRWGKLTANQLGNQNLPEAMGKALDANGNITNAPNNFSREIGDDLKKFFGGLSKNVRTQLSRQAKGENAALLDKMGVFNGARSDADETYTDGAGI